MDSDKWLLAFRFGDMGTAGKAYERCRDLLLDLDLDASVFRIQLNGTAHVVAIGDGPLLPAVRDRFRQSGAPGVEAELPDDIAGALLERRRRGKVPGAFWERRSG